MHPVPVTPDDLEQYEFPVLHAAADHWAAERPGDAAVLNATRGSQLTWGDLRSGSLALAAGLARLGFRKGDVLAVSGPLSNEHILLEYACFRLGVIHAPLDVRLHLAEVVRSVNLIRAKGYVFTDKAPGVDFPAIAEEVRRRCDSVEHLIPLGEPRVEEPPPLPPIRPDDAAQIIFTTGSTGSPKPALLSHRGITCQNLCLARAFRFGPGQRVLCNLPASHVGGQAELLLTTLHAGGAAVTLEAFDAAKSLDAIERYDVTLIGQIPAMFQMEWRTA
ncbi:MAG: acyl--CoA ligase, partial [Acidobacteriia bacterium]|nr:acyl--CoA ligase [Terriglobia bacterium]